MKRAIIITLALAMCLAFFAGCSSKSATASESPAASAAPSAAALSGTVSTNGSTSMDSVISGLSEAFMAKYPGVTVTYDSTGSGAGITAVSDGTADIGLASRDLKSTETGLDETAIAIDGIAIIVNKANTAVTNLTIAQLASLATGAVTNWKDLGGSDAPIVFVGREAGSGTRDGFESIVNVANKCKYAQELTSTGAVIAAVAANANAIGYASLSAVSDTVTTIKVEGIACTKNTILDGTYKIQRNFNIITKQGKELSPAAKAFIEFASSKEAAPIIEKAGAFTK